MLSHFLHAVLPILLQPGHHPGTGGAAHEYRRVGRNPLKGLDCLFVFLAFYLFYFLFWLFGLVKSHTIPPPTPQIKETVLRFIYQNGLHEKLVDTKLFPLLKEHIVSCGHYSQVHKLVDCLISRKWSVILCLLDCMQFCRSGLSAYGWQSDVTVGTLSKAFDPNCSRETLTLLSDPRL